MPKDATRPLRASVAKTIAQDRAPRAACSARAGGDASLLRALDRDGYRDPALGPGGEHQIPRACSTRSNQ